MELQTLPHDHLPADQSYIAAVTLCAVLYVLWSAKQSINLALLHRTIERSN